MGTYACITVTLLMAVGVAAWAYSSMPPPDVTEPSKLVLFNTVWGIFSLVVNTYESMGFGTRADFFRKYVYKPPGGPPDPALQVTDTIFNGTKVRIYQPQSQMTERRAGLIYFHGGGWVYGSVDGWDPLVRHIAKETGLVVVSVDYRLAPEYMFPVPFEDCFGATKYFLQHAGEYGVNPARIGVAGDSAGGNLAAAVALKMKREYPGNNDLPPLKLQVLIYPPLQAFDFQTPSYIRGNTFYVGLSPERMVRFWIQYLNNNMSYMDTFTSNHHTLKLKTSSFSTFVDHNSLSPILPKLPIQSNGVSADLSKDIQDILNPYFAPLMAEDDELHGLPKTCFLVCGIDVLRDDAYMYAKRLEKAGVQVRLAHYPSGFHGIITVINYVPMDTFSFEIGTQALKDMSAYMKKEL